MCNATIVLRSPMKAAMIEKRKLIRTAVMAERTQLTDGAAEIIAAGDVDLRSHMKRGSIGLTLCMKRYRNAGPTPFQLGIECNGQMCYAINSISEHVNMTRPMYSTVCGRTCAILQRAAEILIPERSLLHFILAGCFSYLNSYLNCLRTPRHADIH